jgi:ATP-dependent Zn protease
MILRSTTADSYFESDREARVMLQREHAAARRFVKRQAAAIDALTEVLFEKKSVDDSEISVRISQSPRSASLIAHTRPAKGLLLLPV